MDNEEFAQEIKDEYDDEIWQSDEGISPEDNAEVWENDKDYSDASDSISKKFSDKFKSLLKSNDEEQKENSHSFFSPPKFTKDLGKHSDLNDMENSEENEDSGSKIDEGIEENHNDSDLNEDTSVKEKVTSNFKTPKFSNKVDLDSDDYIVVEHDNDKVSKASSTKHEDVDLDSDDYIVVEHDNDEIIDETQKYSSDSDVEPNFDEEMNMEYDNLSKNKSSNDKSKNISKEPIADDKVDLGSEDDYIYVDHSHDDERVLDNEDKEKFNFHSDEVQEEQEFEINKKPQSQKHYQRKGSNFVKSIISDVVSGEPHLEQEEIETVRGEIIDDNVNQYKPAPSDDSVVEAEIVNDDEELNILNDNSYDNENLEKPTPKYVYDDEELNIFNDNLPDDHLERPNPKVNYDDELNQDSSYEETLEKPTPKMDYTEGDELNIFTDKFSDLNKDEINKKATDVVGRAMEEFLEDVFEKDDSVDESDNDDEVIIEENNGNEQNLEEISNNDIGDGVTYYQGSNDVMSKLRKNNFYYEEEKPKSVRESIKGIKKDMKYINKSLKEIENPTHIDYVSVVDRTEEFDPMDYLNMPSDDDSDKIIEKEEELTFAEKEEQRIEKEMMMDALKKEIKEEKDVIIPVHEQERREDLKDQALENIILSANEDYKEIERERRRKDNQFKSFDDNKLPGKRKMEDEIVDYVHIEDIGLHSSDELYRQSIEKVAKSINDIVDIEGPIHVSEVTKRVKDSCNIKRAGINLKRRVNEGISEAENAGYIIRIGDFLYDASNNNIVIRKRNKPNIELISDEEIAKNIETVLLHKQNVTTKQVAKETSRNFGFKSTSKKTSTRINSVLDLMIANNKVKLDNDIVELK